MKVAHKRILIIGEAGRGKSTLAEKLSKKLGLPHYSTDDIFWEVKYTKSRDRSECRKIAEQKLAEEKWIMEGTTQWLLEPGLKDADIIIFLNFKSILHQWAVLVKRHFTRENQTIMSTLNLLKHVFYKRYNLGYKKGAVTHRELIKPHATKVIFLDSFKKINEFVNNIE